MKRHLNKTICSSLLLTTILVSGTLAPSLDSHKQGVASAQETSSTEKVRKTQLPEGENVKEPVIEVPAGPHLEPIPRPSVDAPKADSIVVKYKSGTNAAAIAANYGLKPARTLPSLGSEVLKLPEGADIDALLARIKADPNVLYAEPDAQVFVPEPSAIESNAPQAKPASQAPIATTDTASTKELATVTSKLSPLIPNDPIFPEQWALHNTLDTDDWPASISDIDINAPEAWPTLKNGGKEVVVAVISDGVDGDHPDLADRVWTNPKEIPNNGIDDDGNGFIDDVHGWDFNHEDNNADDLNDPSKNGTAIAGIVAASMNNSVGIAGVAPNAKILPIKTFSSISRSGTFSQIAAGIAYAEQMGADIAVLDFATWEPSELILDALRHSDMLFIAQPGDYRDDVDRIPTYPASYMLPNVLTVNGIGRNGYSSTSYGKNTVQIAAPANDVITTMPSENLAYAAQIDTGSYRAIYNGLGFENFAPPFQTDSFRAALDYLGEGADKPSVLLVQDDNSVGGNEEERSFLELYKSFLLSAGFETDGMPLDDARGTFHVETVPKNDKGPALEDMQAYDIVIWFTGYANASTNPDPNAPPVLTESDKTDLTSYLQAGGRLLLTGRDALFGSETSSFVKDTLHLDYLYEGFFGYYDLVGEEGTIYAGQSVPMPEASLGDVVAARDSFARTNLLLDKPDYDLQGSYGTPAIANAAGAAALVLGENPAYDAKQTIQRLINSGKKISSLADTNMSGKLIDAYHAISDKDIPGTPLQTSELSERLEEASDPDRVYAVDLHAGETIQAELTGDEGTDFDLYLFSPSAVTVHGKTGIVAASEHPGTSNESFTYFAKQTGTYYVNVYAYAGTGDFTLRLQHANPSGAYEDDSEAVTFVGDWETVSDDALSGGSAKRIDAPGHAELSFDGSYIEWIGTKNPQQGIANVYLDGKLASTVSLYDKTESKRQALFKKTVSNDKHTIRIEWTGKTDPRAKKNDPAFVNVDAFIVKHLVQDADFYQVHYDGTWTTSFSTVYSGQSVTTSIAKDDFAELSFTGTKIRLLAPIGSNRGIADIYIDGKLTGSADLYRPARKYEAVVFESGTLSAGKHTVRVVNSGKKNASSTGSVISIDAFEIVS
ncbi:S8 family serine peptidase [Paenibacillus glycanilyticus]|uniref:S8 family serine peptidase n=1 Tax=Paenibacillus glycanilyticus TaxID=126569 RepID=UPI00203B1EED|nr:S8 family serine peptidase [Paenibacillus glycanilyticus]MCM3630534.1 S8 family serine peptidase [Paenibacillus glycanilyticus]